MITNRTLVRVPLLVTSGALAVVALAACSSSGSGAGTTSASTPPAQTQTQPQSQTTQPGSGSATAVTATETEFHIALSSSSLKAGTYTFTVKNAGKITHALTVDGSGVDKSTGDISPGSSATLTVTLKAGKYDVFCPVGDHKAEGMDETVQVS